MSCCLAIGLIGSAWFLRDALFEGHSHLADHITQKLAGLGPLGESLAHNERFDSRTSAVSSDAKSLGRLGDSMRSANPYYKTDPGSSAELEHLIHNPSLLGKPSKYGLTTRNRHSRTTATHEQFATKHGIVADAPAIHAHAAESSRTKSAKRKESTPVVTKPPSATSHQAAPIEFHEITPNSLVSTRATAADVLLPTDKDLDAELATLNEGNGLSVVDPNDQFKRLLDRTSGVGRAINSDDLNGFDYRWSTQDADGASANGRLPLPNSEVSGEEQGFVRR